MRLVSVVFDGLMVGLKYSEWDASVVESVKGSDRAGG